MSLSRTLVMTFLIAISVLPLGAQQPASTIVPPRGNATRPFIARAKENALTMIQGNALDSTSGQMNNALVRLRDARFGRIVDTQLTDKAGLFVFKALDPGSYVVEVMADDQSILAASQLLNVNAGEVVSAVVKLPFRLSPFTGLLGNPGAATAIAIAAAASGVASVVPTIPISPNQ